MQKSLYQKYRPSTLSEIVGHDKIVTTIRNALIHNQIGHAYLFAGPRGTGKTTLARIMARAVNCQSEPDEKCQIPCGECDMCKLSAGNQAMDIIEIDAASNRGIDEIRDLREKIKFAPTNCKYKVYIIDEVHMLTKEAFNALLKTLEEPPPHVIFIMATTEAYKLPATILSRVQRFDFGRITQKEIEKNLKNIAGKEKIDISGEAIALLASKASGSHRDGISLLEQIKSYAAKISLKEVEEVLGITGQDLVDNLLVSIQLGDRRAVLTQVEDYLSDGFDLSQLALALGETLRQILFVKAEVPSFFSEKRLKTLAPIINLPTNKLTEAIELLLKSVKEIKNSQIQSLPLEIALSKVVDFWAVRPDSPKAEAPDYPVAHKDMPKAEIAKHTDKLPVDSNPVVDNKPAESSSVGAAGENVDEKLWKEVLAAAKSKNHSLGALLRDIKPVKIEENKLYLVAKFKFHADKITEAKNRDLVEQVVSSVAGRKLGICCSTGEINAKKAENPEELLKTAEEIFS